MRSATGSLLVLVLAAPVGLAAAGADLAPWGDELKAALAARAAVAEAVWPGWTAPFHVLVLDGEREVLVGRDPAPAGFAAGGEDPDLGPFATRGPVLPPQLLATMPLFGPPPAIVVGTPEQTGKGATEWVLVLLHEHFHQWQMRDPEYFAATAALGLDGGDTSGRWMLDYPFPYDEPAVGAAFAAQCRRLAGWLRGEAEDVAGAAEIWRGHAALAALLPPGARRYLDFQLWQEGVARFVELRVAEEAVARRAISDPAEHAAMAAAAQAARAGLLAELEAPALAEHRRVSFYAYGAGLALLLERTDPAWKERYEAPRFRLAPARPLD